MIIICCFISRSFSNGIMKCYISGTIYKIAIFWNLIATFVGIWEKLLLLKTHIATFVGISKKKYYFLTKSAGIYPGKATHLLFLV